MLQDEEELMISFSLVCFWKMNWVVKAFSYFLGLESRTVFLIQYMSFHPFIQFNSLIVKTTTAV